MDPYHAALENRGLPAADVTATFGESGIRGYKKTAREFSGGI
jgi:hypothetical protein